MKLRILCLLFLAGMIGNVFAQTDSVTIGSATGYSKIETDGTLEFAGNATVWDDYVVPFTSAKLPPSAGGTQPAFEEFISGSNLYAYHFDTQNDQVFFTIQMPHSWAGTTIYPHIHWSPRAPVSQTTLTWGIDYTWVNYQGTFAAATPITVDVTDNGTAHEHLIAKFDTDTGTPGVQGIEPSASQDGISSILVVRFYRADGTYDGEAFALSFDIHYEKNTAGSRQEYIK